MESNTCTPAKTPIWSLSDPSSFHRMHARQIQRIYLLTRSGRNSRIPIHVNYYYYYLLAHYMIWRCRLRVDRLPAVLHPIRCHGKHSSQSVTSVNIGRSVRELVKIMTDKTCGSLTSGYSIQTTVVSRTPASTRSRRGHRQLITKPAGLDHSL